MGANILTARSQLYLGNFIDYCFLVKEVAEIMHIKEQFGATQMVDLLAAPIPQISSRLKLE